MEILNSSTLIGDLFAVNLAMVGTLFATYILLLSFVYTKMDERELIVDEIRGGNNSHLLTVKEDATNKSIDRYNNSIKKILIQLVSATLLSLIIFGVKSTSASTLPLFTVPLSLFTIVLALCLSITICRIHIEYKKKLK